MRTRRIATIAAAAIVLVAGVCFLLGQDEVDSWFDSSAAEGQYEGKSQEEIIAALNAQVEEGMMNISIASVVKFPDGAAAGEARIENIQANHVDQKVSITLDDTGQTVYESGAIAPGQYIQHIKLSEALAPGTYTATATFSGYDRETHDKTGAAAAQITLIVEG